MAGLSVLRNKFTPPLRVSTAVLEHIREMQVEQGQGVRQFQQVADHVEKDANGVLVLRGSENTGNPVNVV